jgi:hypothetical protein
MKVGRLGGAGFRPYAKKAGIGVEISTYHANNKFSAAMHKLHGAMMHESGETATDLAHRVHEQAMQNLKISMAGSEWGHSENPTERIENTVDISPPRLEGNREVVTLKYTSPHAQAVEYGGFGVVKGGLFAIGKQQGLVNPQTGVKGFPAQSFTIQSGYLFLQRAIEEICPDSSEAGGNLYVRLKSKLGF